MEINKKIALLRSKHDIFMQKYRSELDDIVFNMKNKNKIIDLPNVIVVDKFDEFIINNNLNKMLLLTKEQNSTYSYKQILKLFNLKSTNVDIFFIDKYGSLTDLLTIESNGLILGQHSGIITLHDNTMFIYETFDIACQIFEADSKYDIKYLAYIPI